MKPFNTQFTLSREYLSECFDQSLPYGKNAKPNYLFPVFMLATGIAVLNFTDLPKGMGSMIVALGFLELIHIRFRKAWWLTRQSWGKNVEPEIELTVDDEGIKTQSPHSKTTILWTEIEQVIETDLGLILVTKAKSQQYLSKSLFPDALVNKIIKSNSPS